MQASIRQIHDLLLTGQEVKVQLPNRAQANSLRVSLYRRHKGFQAFGISEEDVSMKWQPQGSFAIYRLVVREAKTFVVLTDESLSQENSDLSAAVEHDSCKQRADNGQVSEKLAGATGQSDAAVQVSSQRDAESVRTADIWQDGDSQN
jgi:hypothetical protein